KLNVNPDVERANKWNWNITVSHRRMWEKSDEPHKFPAPEREMYIGILVGFVKVRIYDSLVITGGQT
ncbi:MAG: hypothetical protein ACFFBD_21140, partial [Candidatus Hodarchaeota archaeon]